MNLLDRLIASVAPQRALARARARVVLQALMHYDVLSPGGRTRSLRGRGTDADSAAGGRERLAHIARDLVRNSPLAARAQQVIASNVVGDGIIPKITGGSERARADLLRRIEDHLDTTAIDAEGRANIYGLQRLAINTVVDAGECLIRFRPRRMEDGLPLPFQLQILEPDYLDTGRDGSLPGGGLIREGIEYDPQGRRVAYYLFREHPGGGWRRAVDFRSVRVPAETVTHVYRQDRPGQMRGVSWFAPIALKLRDIEDHDEAQLMRQKIAACFAAFRVQPDADFDTETDDAGMTTLTPGRIQNLMPGEDIRFADPPGVSGYDDFTRSVLRSVAAGMGITYEALSGDLSQVNFTSGRMGRMEMDRNVSAWQWLMMVPQMCLPVGRWTVEAWRASVPGMGREEIRLDWVPPHRALVDPTREVPALANKVRAGFASRRGVISELGFDPERVMAEIKADADDADAMGLVFDTDPRRVSAAGLTQVRQEGSVFPEPEGGDDDE